MNLMIGQFAKAVSDNKSKVIVYLDGSEWKFKSSIGGVDIFLSSQRKDQRSFKSLDTAIQYASSNLYSYDVIVSWK